MLPSYALQHNRKVLMRKLGLLLLVLLLLLAGCQRDSQSNRAGSLRNSDLWPVEGGAISSAPIVTAPASDPPPAPAQAAPPSREIDWSPLELEDATVHVSCNVDYRLGNDIPLGDIGQESLRRALAPCEDQRLVRVRYRGKIDRGFVSVMERVTVTADELGIDKRVLDLDSAGGQIEDAIRAGDFIAESHWTIWVPEGAICHSACVLILGAGDMRMIAGKVGIHRIIRMSSTASSRAELNAELNAVYQRVREYLARNGVAVAVAELMMAVPNRWLRLLTSDELHIYGLDGVNPVQDDLDRVQLMRRCGEDFARRRDGFLHAFEVRCQSDGDDLGALNECGLELRTKCGFPDRLCAAESPLSEFDAASRGSPSQFTLRKAPGDILQ